MARTFPAFIGRRWKMVIFTLETVVRVWPVRSYGAPLIVNGPGRGYTIVYRVRGDWRNVSFVATHLRAVRNETRINASRSTFAVTVDYCGLSSDRPSTEVTHVRECNSVNGTTIEQIFVQRTNHRTLAVALSTPPNTCPSSTKRGRRTCSRKWPFANVI